MHPLWFYKHQHDSRVRSKLYVACQRWWFQWRFWFVPSVPGYLREEEEHKPDPWHNPIERNHMGLHLSDLLHLLFCHRRPTIVFPFTHAPCFLKLCIPPSNGIVRWWLLPEFGEELPLDNCNWPTFMKCKYTKRLLNAVRRHLSKLRSKRRST